MLGTEAASAFWKSLLTGKLGPDEQRPFKIIMSIFGQNMQTAILENLQLNKPRNYYS
jgi:hypothetical protein